MKQAQTLGEIEQIRAAASLNWHLWTIFQADLLDEKCPLPDDIRSNMLSLAAFVDKHTVDILADPEPGKFEVLISINRELAAGLRVPPPQESVAAPAAAPLASTEITA